MSGKLHRLRMTFCDLNYTMFSLVTPRFTHAGNSCCEYVRHIVLCQRTKIYPFSQALTSFVLLLARNFEIDFSPSPWQPLFWTKTFLAFHWFLNLEKLLICILEVVIEQYFTYCQISWKHIWDLTVQSYPPPHSSL